MLAGCFILAASATKSNAQVSLNVHVGAWNPPAEYSGVNYYYLPDVESYYYVPTHQYVYQEQGQWVRRASLPPRYSSYDINSGYKVAVNRPRPYKYFAHDRDTYARYRGTRNVIVRDNYVVSSRHSTPRTATRITTARRGNNLTTRKTITRRDAHGRPHTVTRVRTVHQ